ncbi:MAG: SCP2 sterol-binding domain-containing protein [Wenzhouxiangellaceae bacterium]|nr:SCP2 sterol-binding domain-containing protein [Wenzhouxiangellaceae bacterium]
MGRYMTPLPGVMAAAIEFVVRRAVALDENSAEIIKPLDGRWMKFELEGLNIDLWLGGQNGELRVLAEPESEDIEPDTTISGSPGALLAMAIPELSTPGGVRIAGDAHLTRQFQQVMKSLDPDIEKALTEYFGELFGPQIYRMLREAAEASRKASATAADQVTHWFKNESDLVPSSTEWREFSDGVDRFRDAVDRLENRVRRTHR